VPNATARPKNFNLQNHGTYAMKNCSSSQSLL
jgi:hypothetical protein